MPSLCSAAPVIRVLDVVLAMVEKPEPRVTVGLLLTYSAPIKKSLFEVVVRDTEAVEAVPVDVLTVLRLGSKGLAVLVPLIPNAIITNL